jgi:hypothetical protein
MRGKVAKRLRRIARREASNAYQKDRIYYFTKAGTKLLAFDCVRGRYQALKKAYRELHRRGPQDLSGLQGGLPTSVP